ncbi:LytR C-terminal domain-containing protein [Kineococcus sp. SYSU DK004]|uniref:LytR C-terminal domain-containing protein n=1 Tax=Kineococcus sp. SYSU DK004 TaxID=3383125 RepID=UPI003D7CAD21
MDERREGGGAPDDARRDERGDQLDDQRDDLDEDQRDDLDEVAVEEELSRRRHRRLVRQRVVFAVVVVAVLATGGVAALVATDRIPAALRPTPSASPAGADPACAPADPALVAPADVTVAVLNSTGRRGLAAGVAAELRTRGFVVSDVANAAEPAGPVTAVVRHPPQLLEPARAVVARVPGAQLAEDPEVGVVELVLGDAYAELAPEDALQPPPAPLPPGC